MGKLIDLTGQRFGRLVVISMAIGGRTPNWNCICDCGTEKIINGISLREGRTKSCGCLSREIASVTGRKHGKWKEPIYKIWSGMKSRCYNKTNTNYPYYGGRGIAVCERWLEFKNFYEDMGDRPKGKSIDRIDNNGDYGPNNCRWATKKEQGSNMRTTRMITYLGETQCLAEWVRKLGIPKTTLWHRLRKYPPNIAFNL